MPLSVKVKFDASRMLRFAALMKAGIAHPGVIAIDDMFERDAKIYEAWARRRFLAASQGDGTWPPLALSTLLARRKGGAAKYFSVKGAYEGRGSGMGKALMAFYKDEFKGEKNRLMQAAYMSEGTKMNVRRIKGLARAHAQNETNRVAKRMGVLAFRTRRESVAMLQNANGYSSWASILMDTGELFGALTVGAAGNISKRVGPSMAFGIGGPDLHGSYASIYKREGISSKATTIGKIAAYHQNGGTIPGRPPKREIVVVPPKGDPIYKQFVAQWNIAAKQLMAEA
jgi:hypothetical protein